MNYKICLPMKLFMLFCFGGCAYTITELLFRGNSHWTMFILGGICFLLVGVINEKFDLSLPVQMAVLEGMELRTAAFQPSRSDMPAFHGAVVFPLRRRHFYR